MRFCDIARLGGARDLPSYRPHAMFARKNLDQQNHRYVYATVRVSQLDRALRAG
jgi:hypothetical protein